MNVNYSKIFIVATAAVLFASMPAHAQPKPVITQVSGEIAWIDVQLGQLQLTSFADNSWQETQVYRISLQNTLVTDPMDQEYLVVKDLHEGQFIKMDVSKRGKNGEELFVSKIVTDLRSTPQTWEFNFNPNEARLNNGDMRMVNDIAAYLKKNPSLQIGLDGTASESRDQALNDHRVDNIRAALIKAGVPADRISTTAIGNRDLRRNGRIEALLVTA